MPNYKVIDADKFDSDLTMLADGIRAKLNSKTPLRFPDEMAEAIRTRGATFIPKTITENGEYNAESEGADGYSPITVSVREQLEGFFDGSLTELNLPTITSIKNNALNGDAKITKVTAPNVTSIGTSAFQGSKLVTLDAPKVEVIGDNAFQLCSNFVVPELPQTIRSIGKNAFANCKSYNITEFPASLRSIGDNAFNLALGTITFKGIPDPYGISSNAFPNTYNRVINVPWSQDWVEGAPWGAFDATINYDVFGDGTPLNDTRWRFDERLPDAARELFYDYYGDGENDFWRVDCVFFANGVEYYGIEWDSSLYYITEDGDFHQVTDWHYEEDEEGNEVEYQAFINEADREITIEAGYDWLDITAINEYSGESVPTFFFHEWLNKYATKL